MLRTEVTNEQYKRCVDADVCEPPNSLSWDKPRSARLPVTSVNWEQAQTYAAWVGAVCRRKRNGKKRAAARTNASIHGETLRRRQNEGTSVTCRLYD